MIVRHSILAIAVAGAVLLVMSRPPIPQALDYHVMADQRPLLGIPNSLNVLSNVPFAIVGLLGLTAVFGWKGRPDYSFEARPPTP